MSQTSMKSLAKAKTKNSKTLWRASLIALTLAGATLCSPAILSAAANVQATLSDWPAIQSPFKKEAAMEARIADIVKNMTLRQKIGQMTQPEIKKITPAEVRQYYIGSVLNGGGSWPAMNKNSTVQDWVNLADAYYDASTSTDMATQIPVIWGIDAVHGNNNVIGATIYPHNIGLGATRNPALIGEIAAATGKSVRATGINWAFAPTLAVVQNNRWGRTYESYSVDPRITRQYAAAFVRGMQGDFKSDTNVVATAKHFIGDGGTFNGIDQGENRANLRDLINIHGQGYYGALGAGVQTVMTTYNSWSGAKTDTNNGKLHGVKELLTGALKEKMGFDGFVISDWNAIDQVQGCTIAHCPAAINAGNDMIMVPDDWKEFIENTVKDVEEGRIPMSRIDDAVTRILRVKMRAGLFGKKPSASSVAGKVEALSNRPLARRAVRESLVLLKNNGGALPLAQGKRILVIGSGADSMVKQAGGWTVTWQGEETTNADIPNGDTLLAAIRAESGANNVVYSEKAEGVNVNDFDAVIAVLGERPYAEMKGDILYPETLNHSQRYGDDVAALNAVSGKGVPVVTVLYSGRTLYANPLINKSDAFVAAFLPGTEAKGITDVLFKGANGRVRYDFRGKLSFAWPSSACPPAANVAQGMYTPLFAFGYGLNYRQTSNVGQLPLDSRTACVAPQ